MKSIAKAFSTLLILLILAGAGYYYRDQLKPYFDYAKPYLENIKNAIHPLKPCKDVITYSLGDFDDRFGLSRDDLLEVLADAEKPWEDAEGKTLFNYEPDGDMKINLIYDYRQAATEQMEKVGIAINDDKATYDALKQRYDSLTASYDRQKAQYDKDIAAYNARSAAYEKKVQYYNSRGGAPQPEYDQLNQEKKELNIEASSINAEQKALNKTGDDINSTVTVLNTVATKLNLKVENYNNIGSSTGEEFNEGEYIRDNTGTHIDIYQFESKAKLRRVLIHELGHALGLGHVDDKNAIMYRLNTSSNEKLTPDDLAELKKACGTN